MFDSGANLFSELKSIFENGAASSGGSHPTTLKCTTRWAVHWAPCEALSSGSEPHAG